MYKLFLFFAKFLKTKDSIQAVKIISLSFNKKKTINETSEENAFFLIVGSGKQFKKNVRLV